MNYNQNLEVEIEDLNSEIALLKDHIDEISNINN